MLHKRGNTLETAKEKAAHQVQQMRAAFEDAEVVDFEHLLPVASDLPDAHDAHDFSRCAENLSRGNRHR